jgi:hypothetical protein
MRTSLILETEYDGLKERDVVECSDSSRAKTTVRIADLLRDAMVDLQRRKNERRRTIRRPELGPPGNRLNSNFRNYWSSHRFGFIRVSLSSRMLEQ